MPDVYPNLYTRMIPKSWSSLRIYTVRLFLKTSLSLLIIISGLQLFNLSYWVPWTWLNLLKKYLFLQRYRRKHVSTFSLNKSVLATSSRGFNEWMYTSLAVCLATSSIRLANNSLLANIGFVVGKAAFRSSQTFMLQTPSSTIRRRVRRAALESPSLSSKSVNSVTNNPQKFGKLGS